MRLLNERFPHVCEKAERLFEQDEDFRELCEDYESCTRTVARLERGTPSAEGMRKEYGALLLRLECELLRYLEEHRFPDES
jgi:hypothetical protein